MPSTATSVRAWRAQNPERARLIAKRYRDKHKAEINERRRARSRDASPRTRSYTPEQKRNYQLANREYYRRNAEAINQKRRQRYAGDPDCKAKRKCSDKEYGAKNQHKKHSYNRKYYQENKARVLQSVHAYYREHRERTIAKKREWSAANRSRSRKIGRDKDARKMGALGSHTFGQWMARVEFYGSRCFYCRTVVTDKTVTQDHAIPLSRGGTNFASNLLPACRPCNSRKNSKTVFEYLGLK